MVTKVQKWGNSLAVRIPRSLAEETRLADASGIDLTVSQGRLLLTPLRRRRYRLADLLAGVTRTNRHAEVDFGPPVGREIL